jgi:secreted trypsin-like serine protease
MGDVKLALDDSLVKPQIGGRSFRVGAKLICSAKFDGKCSHGNDLALLELSEALPSWVKPVVLDFTGNANPGDTVTSIGHGSMENEEQRDSIGDVSALLREVSLTVFPDDSAGCTRVYAGGYGCSDEYSEGEASNKEQQLCAGAPDDPPRDTCAGDSGSPMLNEAGVQVGIVSYGGGPGSQASGPKRMCAAPDYPGIYARLSAFADFVREHVKDLPTGS